MNDCEYLDGCPSLISYTMNNGESTIAWCDQCKKWHLHGKGGGHRVAHCFDRSNSIYRETGYNLDIRGPATKEIMIDFKRKRPKGIY